MNTQIVSITYKNKKGLFKDLSTIEYGFKQEELFVPIDSEFLYIVISNYFWKQFKDTVITLDLKYYSGSTLQETGVFLVYEQMYSIIFNKKFTNGLLEANINNDFILSKRILTSDTYYLKNILEIISFFNIDFKVEEEQYTRLFFNKIKVYDLEYDFLS